MADFRLETERLILRDWGDEDWEPFWEGTNTPGVMRWLGGVLDEDGMAAARARLESYRDEHGSYGAGTWVRYPAGSRHTPVTAKGCRLYVKAGHLADG